MVSGKWRLVWMFRLADCPSTPSLQFNTLKKLIFCFQCANHNQIEGAGSDSVHGRWAGGTVFAECNLFLLSRRRLRIASTVNKFGAIKSRTAIPQPSGSRVVGRSRGDPVQAVLPSDFMDAI